MSEQEREAAIADEMAAYYNAEGDYMDGSTVRHRLAAFWDRARASLPDSAGEAGPWSEKTALEKAPSIIMQLEVAAERFTRYSHDTIDGLLQEAADALRALAAPHPVGSALTEARIDAAFHEKDAEGNWVTGGCNMYGFKRAVRWTEGQLAAAPAPAPASAGWKLVPIEPTDDMETAAENDYELNGETFPNWKSKWRAMIAAAPSHPPATPVDLLAVLRSYHSNNLSEAEAVALISAHPEPAVAVQAEPARLKEVRQIIRRAIVTHCMGDDLDWSVWYAADKILTGTSKCPRPSFQDDFIADRD